MRALQTDPTEEEIDDEKHPTHTAMALADGTAGTRATGICLGGRAGEPHPPLKVVEARDLGTCGEGADAFTVKSTTTVTSRLSTFFDKEGNVDRLRVHLRFARTLTNSRTGKVVTDTPDPSTYFLEDGVLREVGLIWHIVVPGEGVLVIEAGVRILEEGEDPIIHGPHPVFEQGFEVICRALE